MAGEQLAGGGDGLPCGDEPVNPVGPGGAAVGLKVQEGVVLVPPLGARHDVDKLVPHFVCPVGESGGATLAAEVVDFTEAAGEDGAHLGRELVARVVAERACELWPMEANKVTPVIYENEDGPDTEFETDMQEVGAGLADEKS